MKIGVIITLIIAIATAIYSGVDKTKQDKEILQLKKEISELKSDMTTNQNNVSNQGVEIPEDQKDMFEEDKKKWSFMKDLFSANQSYKSDNNMYAQDLNGLYPYLINEFGFTLDEVTSMINYDITSSKQGKINSCYSFGVVFESDYYKQHHNDDGVFVLSNSQQGICE